MANENKDVLRVETTAANLSGTIRQRQLGFATDSHYIMFKETGGTDHIFDCRSGDKYTADKIYHYGDDSDDTYISFPANNTYNLTVGAVAIIDSTASELVINQGGADVDFRVEGDTAANLFIVDAGSDAVIVNHTAALASARTTILDDTNPQLVLAQDATHYVSFTQDSSHDLTINPTSTGSVIVGSGFVVNHTAALASARTTILDASNPQLVLAQDATHYVSFTQDSSHNLTIDPTSTGSVIIGSALVVNHTAVLASARTTILDDTNPQLALAYSDSVYSTFQQKSSGELELDIVAGINYLKIVGDVFIPTSYYLVCGGTQASPSVTIGYDGTNLYIKGSLPTSDPSMAGQWYADNGVVKISAG